MGVTWISYRKKMELETILGEFELDRSGTVDEQRARLIAFARQPSNSKEIQDRLDELERRFGNAPTGDVKSPIPLDPSLISPEPTTSASLVPPSLFLPRTLVVLLAGRAESWFRTSGLQQASWIEVRREFLDFFLPPRYYQRLEDEIRMHFQKPNEPFKEYLIDIRLQMRRAGFSSDKELERIYENMLPEYQLYTRRQDFRTLTELTHLVTNYEETRSRGGRALENRIPTQRQATGASYAAEGDRMPTRRPQQAPSSGNALNGSLSRNACTSQSAVAPRPEAVNSIGDTLHQYQGRIRATIHMEGQRFTATLDTGATHSFISEGLAQMLDNGRNTRDIRTQVKLADGTCRELTRALAANIYLGSERTPTILLVMSDALDDILLGMDFLSSPATENQPPSWRQALPVADATAAQRNPFRTSTKRVRFQDHVEETPEPSPPLCGTVNSVSHPTEDQVSFQTEEPETQDYPEPWVKEFLDQELAKFDTLSGVSHIAEHRIFMRTDRPLKQRYFPRNPAMRAVIDKQINELLRDGRIEPSKSPHSAPIVIAAKKNGEVRMCVDYRQLNENSVPDAYPLPRIHQILSDSGTRNSSRRWTSKMGIGKSQWLRTAGRIVSLESHAFRTSLRSRHVSTRLETRSSVRIWNPMRLHIWMTSLSSVPHWRSMSPILEKFSDASRCANLRLNIGKCHFFQRRIVYLGHVISEAGIHTDPDKVAAIRGLAPPTNLKELRRCLGIASWYRRFVPHSHNDYGIGAVLTQTIDGNERVIAYASRRLNTAERNYSVTEKECLAIVWTIRKMRCYIEGYRFEVLTDHHSLKWLNSIDNPTGRIARWALELQQYQYDVHYRKGAQNLVADALSRQPLPIVQQAEVQGINCKCITRMLQRIRAEPAKFPDYREENGQLYRRLGLRPEEEEYTPWKLCVGSDYRQRVLEECHDHPTAGHLGVRKTSTRVAQRYYWPGLFREVARYVRRCPTCQRYKVSQEKPAGQMFTRQVEEPFHILCADFVGPLPRSKQGNKMLLVFLDAFSKWVELVPLRKATATHLERAFRERILSRFGVPRTFVCDNGTQFTGRSFQKFCQSLGMELQHTAPYTPRQNPTERGKSNDQDDDRPILGWRPAERVGSTPTGDIFGHKRSRRRRTASLNQLKPYHHEDEADTEAGAHREDTDAGDTTIEDADDSQRPRPHGAGDPSPRRQH
nr:uncharacterized protein LOC121502446 [Drosophila kikkawai]